MLRRIHLVNNERTVPDYKLALEKSVDLLEDLGIDSLPILVQSIISSLSRTIQLTSYGEFSKFTGKTRKEIIDSFKSEDGVCVYKRASEQYIIYFNEEKDDNRFRFTIAHELGHIFLEHHQLAGENILTRSELTSSQYEKYEKEANCFARNLLSPAPLAKKIKDNDVTGLYTLDFFQDEFYIGFQASKSRLDFLSLDLRYWTESMTNLIGDNFPKYGVFCRNCNSELIPNSVHCIICGEGRRFSTSYTYTQLSYEDFITNKKSRQCIRCNNVNITPNSDYCRICSYTLINRCTNRDCAYKNIPLAHYCSVCGSETVFKNKLEENNTKEEPVLYYNDGVDYDKQTYKVEICPKCNNEEFSEDAACCRICGLNLINYCEGYLDEDEWGNQAILEQHPNPSNARFCETCGKPTEYNTKNVLVDYNDYVTYDDVPF